MRTLRLDGPTNDFARQLTLKLLIDLGDVGRLTLGKLLTRMAEGAADEVWATRALAVVERIPSYQPSPIRIELEGRDMSPHALYEAVRKTVSADGAPLPVSKAAIEAATEAPVASFEDYLARCVLDPERLPAVDERFVALSLLIVQRKPGARAVEPERAPVPRAGARAAPRQPALQLGPTVPARIGCVVPQPIVPHCRSRIWA